MAGRVVTDDDGAEPSMEPASARALKSRRTSIIEAEENRRTAPTVRRLSLDGAANAPAWLKMTSCMARHGDFENAGAVTWPLTRQILVRATTGALCDEPIDAAGENLRHVDKGFDVIDDGGLLPEADLTGNGGLLRGSARWPSIASMSALSSPQM